MYLNNVDDLVSVLRTKLQDYLILRKVIKPNQTKFKCLVHDESTPSMSLNPKTDYENAHCFSCNASIDIFAAAGIIDNMPTAGASWVTETLPFLANLLEIPIETGEASHLDKEKLKLYKLAHDMTEIIERPEFINTDYQTLRNWPSINLSTISENVLLKELVNLGWDARDVKSSMLLGTSNVHWFGTDRITFTIKDYRGRPTGFVSRNLTDIGAKYINSAETPIYSKSKSLLGIDTAYKEAKSHGLIIVEGPGDLAALRRVGINNSAAICGTSFTTDHYILLKTLGIKDLYLCLDWDEPGIRNTIRILDNVLKESTGLNCHVIQNQGYKDPDEFLTTNGLDEWKQLKTITAFEYQVQNLSTNMDPIDVCLKMIPMIAVETTAIRRDHFITQLADLTGISFLSIATDVNSIRDNKHQERRDRLKAVAEAHMKAVESDPDNVSTLVGQYEADIRIVEKDYEKDLIGPNKQLARYDAIQQLKVIGPDGASKTTFIMNYFPEFTNIFSGGLGWAISSLIYFGGRANSGKTTMMIAIGLDIALSDPNAIVIMHFTDDNFMKAEPRIKTNISRMINPHADRTLFISEAANPYIEIQEPEGWRLYNQADEKFRELLANEKLIIIDSEDGTTLSALERQVRYIRKNHPDSKILIIEDNTYNLSDYSNLEQTARMTRISNAQKQMADKYRACMMATVEYRKNAPLDTTKLKLPVNDDIADARALMYRPDAILHVYNDLNDRGDAAETFWFSPHDPTARRPRLLLLVSKNKISGFKDKLVVNLDSATDGKSKYNTVSIQPIHDLAAARIEDFKNQEIYQELEEEASEYFEDEY